MSKETASEKSNLDKAVDYFIKEQETARLSADQLMRTLIFLRQCEEQGLTLTGIGYKKFDGSNYGLKGAYEGGFSATKKRI